jgi:hypothetical protein
MATLRVVEWRNGHTNTLKFDNIVFVEGGRVLFNGGYNFSHPTLQVNLDYEYYVIRNYVASPEMFDVFVYSLAKNEIHQTQIQLMENTQK